MTFWDYLKYKRITITAFLIFAAIIFTCQLLFGMPLKILWYPYALCALIGLVFLIIGCQRQRKTCADLCLIADLQAERDYWQRFQTPVREVSNTVYESFLQSYDQTLGLKSYGMI